jgi:hypothetical protein
MRKKSLYPKNDPIYRQLLEDHNELTRMMVELYEELHQEIENPDAVVKRVKGLGKWFGQQAIPAEKFKKGL